MKDREVELLFTRLLLYDQLDRRIEGLVCKIQRMMRERHDVRREIEHMRVQVGKQRKEILQLQRAGILTESADALLQRMLDKIGVLCLERDRLKGEQGPASKRRALGGCQ